MKQHELVSGRFDILALAGSGGMGVVYRALDRQTGADVAVKVLLGHGGDHAERFAREARLLSELHHPGIVRFVASGTTRSGEGYLAMEWLEGESLSACLLRGPLSVAQTLVLGARVAEALVVAHDRGIVHRDLKPGNLFLVGGAVERVMVLDFGIARVLEPGQTLTLTGAMLGTAGYMSPEQSRGDKDVDARTDVFALGCVLFKCLAGRSVFEGTDPLSVTVKMMLEPAPRVGSLRPDVPHSVDDLIDRMLAKPRQDRPRSAAALRDELLAIAAGAPTAIARAARPGALGKPDPTGCILLARAPRDTPRGAGATQMGLSLSAGPLREEDVRAAVAPHGGTLQPLADGSLLVTFARGGGLVDDGGSARRGAELRPQTPVDDVARAARCALAIRPLLPEMTFAVIAGQEAAPGHSATAIDRGVSLLAAPGAPAIRLDADAGARLSTRFEVVAVAGGHELGAERGVSSAPARTAAVTAPAPPRRGNALVIGSLAVAVVALAAVVVLLVLVVLRPGSPGDDASKPTASGCPGERCLQIRAADLSHVDVTELLPSARQIAASLDRSAELTLVSFTTTNGDGTVDVTKPNYAVSYQFQSKSGSIQVTPWGTKLLATHFAGQTAKGVLANPACSAKAAWKAAVSRGAPKSGSAQVTLYDGGPGVGASWVIAAEGASYVLDGRTCASRR